MVQTPEPISWNEVKTLLESQDKTIRFIAEKVDTLCSESGTFKLVLSDIDERVQRLEPIVKSIRSDLDELKKEVKEFKVEVKKEFQALHERLSTAESKLSV